MATKSKKPLKTQQLEDTKAKQSAALLRVVEDMHRDKNISKETIFLGIESAIQLAISRTSQEEEDILVHIDRSSGEIVAQRGSKPIDPSMLGRIAAQSARQVMLQKIREAESDGVFNDFQGKKGELITGTISRMDKGTAIVSLSKDGKSSGSTIEALLPRSEQIPGESFHLNDRVKAVVMDVRRMGHRVKIVLSRRHEDFVRSLFEQEIPEISERTIEIKAIAREAGYRSKVAVSSIDSKVDCVGACVGVRGGRIKNVINELNEERIDIVRWNDSLQVLIPNALQPAEITELMLYPRLDRAIVLVTEDNLSLAIGRRGQNVRLASKLVRWDIDILTHEELGESLDKAERWFSSVPNAPALLGEIMITEGFFSLNDLSCIDAPELVSIFAANGHGISEADADNIILYAEEVVDRGQDIPDGVPFGNHSSDAPVPSIQSGISIDSQVATEASELSTVNDTLESELPASISDLDQLFLPDGSTEVLSVSESPQETVSISDQDHSSPTENHGLSETVEDSEVSNHSSKSESEIGTNGQVDNH